MSVHPEALGWGPGWPHCQIDRLVTVDLGNGIFLPVRRELAVLTGWLCHETIRRGYPLVKGWCWTFACRPIRDSQPPEPSGHSWATAIDVNAPKNGMVFGQPGWRWLHDHNHTDQPSWVPDLWKAHMFGSGMDYQHRQDPMHYEFAGTPADAQRITANLTSPQAPVKLTHTLHQGDHGEPIIGHVQDLLRWYSVRFNAPDVFPGVKDDNYYGPITARSVLAFKVRIHDLETAFDRPLTFRPPLDNTCGVKTLGALEFWANVK